MIESIALDILIVFVVTLLASIGAYRGGIREAFSASGVVLGALLATEWRSPWGDWIADNTNLAQGSASFVVAVTLLVLVTTLVGYGIGASFNYHPGPAGRLFGAGLGAASAVVAIAYVLTWLRQGVFDGGEPEVVANTWIARFLDGDAGLVLLALSIILVFVAIFAAIVRERDDDMVEAGLPAHAGPRSSSSGDAPDKVEPQATGRHPTAPVRVQPSRQWEERSGEMPAPTDRQWANTWPSDAPGIVTGDRPARVTEVQQARDRRKSGQSGTARDGRDRSS